jgi:hypothetical protein
MGGSIFGGLLVFYLTGRRVFQLAKLNIPLNGRNELSLIKNLVPINNIPVEHHCQCRDHVVTSIYTSKLSKQCGSNQKLIP